MRGILRPVLLAVLCLGGVLGSGVPAHAAAAYITSVTANVARTELTITGGNFCAPFDVYFPSIGPAPLPPISAAPSQIKVGHPAGPQGTYLFAVKCGVDFTYYVASLDPEQLAVDVVTRAGNYAFSQGTSDLVPLDAALTTQITVDLTGGGTHIVMYSAECAVNAPAGNSSTWVNLDIELVNTTTNVVTVLPPTAGNSDAFCASNGTLGSDGWQTHTVIANATVPPGLYFLRVRATIQNGALGDAGWLGDTTLALLR